MDYKNIVKRFMIFYLILVITFFLLTLNYIVGISVYSYTILPALFFFVLSLIFLNKIRFGLSMMFGFFGIGYYGFMSSTFLGNAIFHSTLLFDFELSWVLFLISLGISGVILITNFVTIKYIRKINRLKDEDRIIQMVQKDGEVQEYIKKLSSAYNQITINEIIKKFGLKRKFKPMIRSLIVDMIFNKEIEGKIHEDVIYFSTSNPANTNSTNPYSRGNTGNTISTIPESSPNYLPQSSHDSETNSASSPSQSSSSLPFSSVGSPTIHVTHKKHKSKSSRKIIIAIILVISFLTGISLIITGLNMLTSSNPNQGILFIGIGAVLAIPLAILVYDYIFGIENIF